MKYQNIVRYALSILLICIFTIAWYYGIEWLKTLYFVILFPALILLPPKKETALKLKPKWIVWTICGYFGLYILIVIIQEGVFAGIFPLMIFMTGVLGVKYYLDKSKA